MRLLGTSLIVLGLALAALPAFAQETGETSFTLIAANEGGSYIWNDESGARNPTLTVPASTQVTITARQGETDGIPHNIKVGTERPSENFADEGESVQYTFTSPATGTVDYVCEIHPTTMKGTVRVAGSGGDEGGNDSPALGLVGTMVALLGAALLVLRRRG